MTSLLTFLSITPFILFIILLFYKKTSLLFASLAILVMTLAVVFLVWKILPDYILYSTVKGFWVALDILFIIFGAIFFLEILKSLKIIENLGRLLEGFSKDYRVQVILLAWFLESFLEGTTGFGAPLVVVAPILVSLGLKPITAVIICLLGNSASNIFGAVGAPLRIGFAGLDTTFVPNYAASVNLIGFLVPTFILWTLTAQLEEGRKSFWEGLPFAIWSGFAFVVPSLLAVSLGQEFPSIIGAVVGLLLVILTLRLKLFIPKQVRTLKKNQKLEVNLPLIKIVSPYVFLIGLLILGKIFLGPISLNLIIGRNIKHSLSFFNPGFAFIAAGVLVAIIWGERKKLFFKAVNIARQRTIEPFLVIICMSTVVQLMINSGNNSSGLPSVLGLLAINFETPLLPFWAPFIGAFGSFLTGSITISNLMFGNFLNTAGNAIKLNASKILALEAVGAAAGNMIALADILSAETVVGLKNEEKKILKEVIIPCLIYVTLVGIIGLIINYA